MAVAVYKSDAPLEFVGCVLDTYEHNGYDDSDFYAVCWDEETQTVVHIEYDTTRAGTSGWAKVDATEDVIRKVFRSYCRNARVDYDQKFNPRQAKEVKHGDTVVVVRGSKVKKGTVGKVFWKGVTYNRFSYRDEDRVGIEVEGNRIFLPLEYVEVVGWEDRLIKGKERRLAIRRAAVREMPFQYRSLFGDCYFQGSYRGY